MLGLYSIAWGIIFLTVLQEVTARFTELKVTSGLNRVCECASDVVPQNAHISSLLGLREQLLSGERGQGSFSEARPGVQVSRTAGPWVMAHSTHTMRCLAGSASRARLRDCQVKAGWT